MDTRPRWTNDADKKIVEETYRKFATEFDKYGNPTGYQQWFNGAAVFIDHPVTLTRTLEIQANFYPAAELNSVVELSMKHGLPYHINVLRS
jgi:antibiotic biosynthesis monooxygenase (ABM) superfamily enzyme